MIFPIRVEVQLVARLTTGRAGTEIVVLGAAALIARSALSFSTLDLIAANASGVTHASFLSPLLTHSFSIKGFAR